MMLYTNNVIYLIGLLIVLPPKAWGKYCEGGLFCSPPKECCEQGCCYVYPAPGFHPSVPPTNHVFNLFFYNHWYFWCVVGAATAAAVCGCALWRRRAELCGCRRRDASDRDSAGSCYLPPQYSRCSSFHHAPPPYAEVTSKPDLYPLVITYGDNNDKGASSYLMVQYFRNYIIRPTGSISATSTAESLSSSFICNAANEANSVVPPPYSCAGSFDEWRNGGAAAAAAPTHRQALLRSISSAACDQPAAPVRRARLPHSVTTQFRLPIQDTPADAPNERNLTSNIEISTNQPDRADTQNTPSLPVQPTNRQRTLSSNTTRNSIQRTNSAVANNISNVTRRSHDGAAKCVSSNRRLKPVNDKEQFICDNQSNNFNNTTPQKVQTRSWTDNFFTKAFEQSNQCRNISDTNDELSDDRRASFSRPRSNCGNVNNRSVICDYSPESKAIALQEYLISSPVRETKMNITNCNPNKYESVEFANGPRHPIPVTSAARINTVHCHRQSSVDGASFASKDFGSHSNLEDLRCYLHSMTGSEVSSLANLGSPDSPPRATSPTMEVRGLLDKIHNLPSNSDKKHDGAPTAITETKTKRSAMKHRKSSLYMPLSMAPKTSFMGVGRISPAVDNYNTRSIFSHRGWSSRSAPTTPCGASIVPSILTFSQRKISNAGLNTKSCKQNKEESNPLLTECEENDDIDRSHGQF